MKNTESRDRSRAFVKHVSRSELSFLSFLLRSTPIANRRERGLINSNYTKKIAAPPMLMNAPITC